MYIYPTYNMAKNNRDIQQKQLQIYSYTHLGMCGDFIQRHHLLGEHSAEVNNNTVCGAQGRHGLNVAQFVCELFQRGRRVGREKQLETLHALVY